MASNNPSGKKAHPPNVPRSRHDDDVWLVGPASSNIAGQRLPTIQQVLAVYFSCHTVDNRRVQKSLEFAVHAATTFWKNARIPVMDHSNCVRKLKVIVEMYAKVKKGRYHQRNTTKEKEFREMICQLFDIAHHDAMTMITIDEDRQFLSDQRGARIAYMASVDQTLVNKEARTKHRANAAMKRKAIEHERQKQPTATVDLATLGDTSSSESDEGPDAFYIPPSKSPATATKHSPKPVRVISSDLAAALDRTKTSSAMYTIAATSQALGHDVEELALSRSTIRRSRIAYRTERAHSVKALFRPNSPLVLHWDGKILANITGDTLVDRLPIVVSGVKIEQLLGVPQLVAGTGVLMAEAICRVIDEWGITDKVFGMCFDTTASNTGKHAGACVLIEKLLNRSLFHFACRHHVAEVILSGVFGSCFGASKGPDDLLFKRFQSRWQFIVQSQYQAGASDSSIRDVMETRTALLLKSETVKFLVTFDLASLPRDDYRELIELCLRFLGEKPPRQSECIFRRPGAFHHARWMAKMLYCFKIWMFREQFTLTQHEANGLKKICLFGSLIYVPYWLKAPRAVDAALNDLQLMRDLDKYRSICDSVATAADSAIRRHLWYVTDHLIGLCLFSENTSDAEKDKIVLAITTQERPHDIVTTTTRDPRVNQKNTDIHTRSLDKLVTHQSRNLITALGADAILTEPASAWSAMQCYTDAVLKANNIKVVNDCAERGVKLIEDYGNIITQNEDQMQYLLQVVATHRQQFPNPSKISYSK